MTHYRSRGEYMAPIVTAQEVLDMAHAPLEKNPSGVGNTRNYLHRAGGGRDLPTRRLST